MSNQKNKLRNGKNIKVYIYVGIIFFFFLIVLGVIAAYFLIDYELVTEQKFNIKEIADFFKYVSAPQKKAPILTK